MSTDMLMSNDKSCAVQTVVYFRNTFSRKFALVQDKNAEQPWITLTLTSNLPLHSGRAWQFGGEQKVKGISENKCCGFMILIRYCIKVKNIMNTSTCTFYFPSNINS